MTPVAVLFARADSNYKAIKGVDVWDAERDARRWAGGMPVIAHPPCRAWGRLKGRAKPAAHEKDLARFAVAMVRRWGGVLEHPAHSDLWADQGLPLPGARDVWGGWCLPIVQHWFGHRAEKPTWLYVVGVLPGVMPDMPMLLGGASHVIAQDRRPRPSIGRMTRLRKGMPGWRPEVTKAEREHTPPALAQWLVDVARRVGRA